MAASGKRKTTVMKLAREGRLRERRAAKKAKKDARRLSPVDWTIVPDEDQEAGESEGAELDADELPDATPTLAAAGPALDA
jgi:hypothetical protein